MILEFCLQWRPGLPQVQTVGKEMLPFGGRNCKVTLQAGVHTGGGGWRPFVCVFLPSATHSPPKSCSPPYLQGFLLPPGDPESRPTAPEDEDMDRQAVKAGVHRAWERPDSVTS